ncbi:SCO5918 family protein [Streptomyces sp. NPDC014793]|uniref:SCO5918 family protein n=1 Tax=Streptomyces sp. NPDC014793 TaxID=3364914 RepID=UPI0036F97800
MRRVIARHPFCLTESGVPASVKGITPELVTAESVTTGRCRHPVKQVGQGLTRQDRRDVTGAEAEAEAVRAMTRLGFTCHTHPDATPARVPTPLRTASALLGGACPEA